MLEQLELRNFEGYKHAEVNLTKGLNIITGRNSTGKTTLLEALLFGLYGAPGLEKRLLVSKLQGAGDVMSVKLVADVNGKKIEIFREGRLVGTKLKNFRTERLGLKIDGGEVSVNGEEELNRKVGELMGMGVRTFTSLVYARQGELTSILEPKREDMDLLLGISLMKEIVEQLDLVRKSFEKYEGYDTKTMLAQYKQQLPNLSDSISRLSSQVAGLEKEVNELEKVIGKAKSDELKKLLELIKQRDTLAGEIQKKENLLNSLLVERGVKTVEELVDLANEAAEREKKKKTDLQTLERRKDHLEEELNKVGSKLNGVESRLQHVKVSTIEELEHMITSDEEKYKMLNEHAEQLKKDLDATTEERNELMGGISALGKEVKSHEKLLKEQVANCPTCGQKVDKSVLEQIIKNKSQTLEELKQRYKKVDAEYKRLSKEDEKLKKSVINLGTEIKNLKRIHAEVIRILAGKTVKELEDEMDELQRELEGLDATIKNFTEEHAKLENEMKNLRNDVTNAVNYLGNITESKQKLSKCLEEMKGTLLTLGFPFNPEDVDLKAKIAEQLPLSVDELSKKEELFREKRKELQKWKKDLEEQQKEEQKIRAKIDELQRRVKRAELCEKLLENIKGGIESVRRRKLKRIADEALRVYEVLTDQHVYKAFRVDPESYAVEVFPSRLEDYIPAKRTGGGHQTLIALAFRIALLNVLNQRSLLILDEPTYGVDSENLPQLMSFFSEASKKLGQTILVTHYGLGEEEAANVVRVELAPDGSSTAQQA